MDKEEIALRLTEAWTKQQGLPASIDTVIKNYKYTLENLNKRRWLDDKRKKMWKL